MNMLPFELRYPAAMLDPRLLEILCCPACHGDLFLRKEGETEKALDCPACGLRYPIEDGIPVMLVDKAMKVSG